MQPSSIVLRALRSRLSAISLGLPPSARPPTALPLQRVSSWNYGGAGGGADAAGRGQMQPQQLLQPPAPQQYPDR